MTFACSQSRARLWLAAYLGLPIALGITLAAPASARQRIHADSNPPAGRALELQKAWARLSDPDDDITQESAETLFSAADAISYNCQDPGLEISNAICHLKGSSEITALTLSRRSDDPCITMRSVRDKMAGIMRRREIAALLIDGKYVRGVNNLNNDVAEAIMDRGYSVFVSRNNVVFQIDPTTSAQESECLSGITLYRIGQ